MKRKDTKSIRKRVVEESTLTTSTNSGFMKRLSFETEKDKYNFMFPLVNDDGSPRIKTIPTLQAKFGEVLSDGKWHSFQLPESEEVYNACVACPIIEEVNVRFALIIVYDKTKEKKDVPYYYAWLKLSDARVKLINEILEELSDEGIESILEVDLLAKVNKEKNALKMQSISIIEKGDSLVYNNKASKPYEEILEEAKEKWEELDTTVVQIEDDDTIMALLDMDEDDEDEPKSRSRKRKKEAEDKPKKKKKRSFSKKQLDD